MGSGDLSIDTVESAEFKLTMNGSGDAGSTNIAASDRGRAPGSGDLAIDMIEARAVKLSLFGSGDARIGEGRANDAELETSGSGDIGAEGLEVKEATISVCGSGDVSACVSDSADDRGHGLRRRHRDGRRQVHRPRQRIGRGPLFLKRIAAQSRIRCIISDEQGEGKNHAQIHRRGSHRRFRRDQRVRA